MTPQLTRIQLKLGLFGCIFTWTFITIFCDLSLNPSNGLSVVANENRLKRYPATFSIKPHRTLKQSVLKNFFNALDEAKHKIESKFIQPKLANMTRLTTGTSDFVKTNKISKYIENGIPNTSNIQRKHRVLLPRIKGKKDSRGIFMTKSFIDSIGSTNDEEDEAGGEEGTRYGTGNEEGKLYGPSDLGDRKNNIFDAGLYDETDDIEDLHRPLPSTSIPSSILNNAHQKLPEYIPYENSKINDNSVNPYTLKEEDGTGTRGAADNLYDKDIEKHVSEYNKFEKKGSYDDKIADVKVYCDFSTKEMWVDFDFAKPFEGVVYTKGYYKGKACKGIGKGESAFRFKIPLDACGTFKKEQLYYNDPDNDDYGKRVFENIVVIMFEPYYGILNTDDKIYGVKCKESMVGTKRINTGFTIPRTEVTQIIPYTANVPDVYMKITKGKDPGNYATDVLQLGDIATVVVHLPGHKDYDMYLFDCMAHDGLNYGKIRLNDEKGCPVDHNLVSSQHTFSPELGDESDTLLVKKNQRPALKGDDGSPKNGAAKQQHGTVAYFNFKTFKFPDVDHVYFDCFANICFHKCPNRPENYCDKRSKRSFSVDSESNRTEKNRSVPLVETTTKVSFSIPKTSIPTTTATNNDTYLQQVNLFQGVKVVLKGEEEFDDIEKMYYTNRKKISCSCYNGQMYIALLLIIVLFIILSFLVFLLIAKCNKLEGGSATQFFDNVFLKKMNKLGTVTYSDFHHHRKR